MSALTLRTALQTIAGGDEAVISSIEESLAAERDELSREGSPHRRGKHPIAVLTSPPSESTLSAARIRRDDALALSEDPAARRRMNRLRGILAAHDTRVDDLLALPPSGDGGYGPRLDHLQHQLERRTSDYARCLEELTRSLGGAHWGSAVVDEVAGYVDKLTDLLHDDVATAAGHLVSLRTTRDLNLCLVELTEAAGERPRIRRHLADYDATLEALVTAATLAGRELDPETLDQARRLFLARVVREAEREKSWLRMWSAGTALGLAAILLGFFVASRSDPPSWSWLTVCVAGLGALVASFYTFGATEALAPRTHWILVALPGAVFLGALLLPLQGGRFPPATALVALGVVLVLAVMSVWVVRHEPSRPRAPARLPVGWLSVVGGASPDAGVKHFKVADELERLRHRIQEEARAQRTSSIAWATTFLVVGGLAAVLSGAAGVTANQTDSTGLVAGLAIGGGGLTALMTAINPGRRWEQARTLQLACQSLEQEVGVLIKLDLEGTEVADYGRQKIEDIATMYDTLLGVPERPRLWRGSPEPHPDRG